MLTIEKLVEKARNDGASDIHLICGLPPKYRVNGQLENMAEEPLTREDCMEAARALAGGGAETLLKSGELDAAASISFSSRAFPRRRSAF